MIDIQGHQRPLSTTLLPRRRRHGGSARTRASGTPPSPRPSTRSRSVLPSQTSPPPAAATCATPRRPTWSPRAGTTPATSSTRSNDGFLPAWITTQHLRRRQGVVLAVLAYEPAWARRYAEVVAGLSAGGRGGVVDLVNDNRTHCFPGAIVGTRFHGYLSVDPARLRDNKTVLDFHNFLADAYNKPPSQSRIRRMSDRSKTAYQQQQQQHRRRPRLGTRVIENEAAVARLAAHLGFDVDILDAAKTNPPPMAALHAEVGGLDVLVGAHGSDLTSLLFLRPGRAALVQVAPLGVGELAHGLFGVPARLMGLRYVQYDVRGHESSLSRVYEPGDVVVADPERAMRRKEAFVMAAEKSHGQQIKASKPISVFTIARRKEEEWIV